MTTIHGLTHRQVQLMNLLWNCEDMAAVTALINAMPTTQDKHDAQSLVLVLTWETLEQELGLDAYADLATKCIARASS